MNPHAAQSSQTPPRHAPPPSMMRGPRQTERPSGAPSATSSSIIFDYEPSALKNLFNLISSTLLGLLTIIGGGAVYWYIGVDQQDMILKVFGLAVSLISFTFTILAYFEWWRVTARGRSSTSLELTEAEVGQTLLTGFKIPSVNLNPLFQLKVSWAAPEINDYQLELYQGELHELVRPTRRGRLSYVVRRFQLEDLFGLTEITWYVRQPCQLRFSPKSVQTPPSQIKQPQEGEDLYDPVGRASGDLVELRRYQHGDPLRLLLWRVYARNRQLIVRSPERAFSLKNDLIAYFVAHPSDEPSASTARSYLEAGRLGEDYQLFADGCLGSARQSSEGLEHLISSAQGQTLDALPQLLALDPQLLRGCVVFASALTPRAQLLELVEALPSPPIIILSLRFEVDERATKTSGWRSRFTKAGVALEPTSRAVTPQEVTEILETVEALTSSSAPPTLIAQPESQELHSESLRLFVQ